MSRPLRLPIRLRLPSRIPGELVAVVAFAAVLRLWVIGRDALWLDEGYSWWDARQPLADLWSRVPTCDPHPPLYFAVLHGWIAAVGDSTVAMRLLSTLFGIATIVVVHAAGRELDRASGDATRRFGVATLAALLFAAMPFQVYFSIEARPYALLCFGAALLTLGALRSLRATRGTGRLDRTTLTCLVVGALIAAWSNNTAVLLLASASLAYLALWSVDRGSRVLVRPLLLVGLVIAVLWAPDWPLLLEQSREVTQDFWINRPSLAGVAYELHFLIGLDSQVLAWPMAAVAGVGLLMVLRRAGRRHAVVLTAFALLPIVLNVVASYVVAPILIARALIGAAPALALATAAAVVLLRPLALRVVATLALLVLYGIAATGFLTADHVKEPWKPLVARLGVVGHGAAVLVVPNELVLPLGHEAARQNVVLRVRGVPADYPAIGMDARYPSGKCAPSVVGRDLGPLVQDLQREKSVVLLTRLHNTYDPHEDIAAALVAGGFTLASEDVYQPGDLRVMRFAHASH